MSRFEERKMEAQLGGFDKLEKDCPSGDHLLILAHSAELVLESKEDGPTHDGGSEVSAVIYQMRGEENGLCSDGKTPRLSRVRRQARSGSSLVAVQDQERRTRLTQVRQRARSKSHSGLQESDPCMNGSARVTRLSELRREARSRSNCSLGQAVEEVMDKPLDWKTSEENRRREAIIAEIFGEEEGFLGDGDCGRESELERGVPQSVSVKGEANRNMVCAERRTGRASRLRPRARQEKGRQAYTPSGLLLAMLRRC